MGNRRGAVLPLVLMVLSATVLLTFSLVDRGWRLERADGRWVRRETDRVALTRALARQLRSWEASEALEGPPGGDARAVDGAQSGEPSGVWWRLHPLVVGVDVHLPAAQGASAGQRFRRQLLWIALPPWPIAWDSVTGVRTAGASGEWRERLATLQTQGGCHALDRPSTGPWRCQWFSGHHRPTWPRLAGLVVLEGPLELSGDWEVTGLLIVQGPVRLVGGRLTVRGGLLLLPDALPFPATAVTVHPDRGAVDQALAAAGRPSRAPFHLWQRAP